MFLFVEIVGPTSPTKALETTSTGIVSKCAIHKIQ
jgi:hypothetical protein